MEQKTMTFLHPPSLSFDHRKLETTAGASRIFEPLKNKVSQHSHGRLLIVKRIGTMWRNTSLF